jgi:hypothetical protein
MRQLRASPVISAWSWQQITNGTPIASANYPRAALTAGCQWGWCQPKTITMAVGPQSSGPRFFRHESTLQGVGSWTQTPMVDPDHRVLLEHRPPLTGEI